jgi:hypothetical protein
MTQQGGHWMKKIRTEKDVLGELEVPTDAYWGINTQRALENFQISGLRFSQRFILSLAKVKKACALSNIESADLDEDLGNAVLQAVDEMLGEKRFLDQFPIDVFQTGSGTQTNMNMNEVLANRANEILGHPKGMKSPVHPNDHVSPLDGELNNSKASQRLDGLIFRMQYPFLSLRSLRSIVDSSVRSARHCTALLTNLLLFPLVVLPLELDSTHRKDSQRE